MADYLAITTLDVAARQNNREHNVLAHFRDHFDSVTVVYRARFGIPTGFAAMLRDEVHVEHRDHIRYVAVNPRLNPGEGVVQKGALAKASAAKQAMSQLIDTAGILRDTLTIRTLARAAAPFARPDMVCQAFGPWAAAAADRLARQGNLGRWVYVDRDYEPGFMRSAPRIRWAQRTEFRMASRADLTLSIGQRLANRFDGVQNATVAISPTGVDLTNFPAPSERAPGKTIIFVGEVAPWTGIQDAIRAMTHLRNRDLRLDVFGPIVPGYQPLLEAEINRLELAETVTLHGNQPRTQVIDAMAGGSVGFAVFRPHPLRIHAAPLKIWEYMACGLPVLALAGSEAGDIVSRHGTGIACAATPEAIAKALTQMLADPETFRAMSRAGPIAAASHDWHDVLQRERAMLADLYGLPQLAKAAA